MAIRITIQKQLEEISRYKKQFGVDYDIRHIFQERVSPDHPVDYAFTMIAVPKIGIYPGTKFNTPAGVYLYPLDEERYEQLIENQLPYVSGNPYVGLVKLDWDKKWLLLDNAGADDFYMSDYRETEEYIKDQLRKYYPHKTIKNISELAKHWDFSTNAKIFDMTYFASKWISEELGLRSTVLWRKMLRDLGYVGVYDSGNSIIHPGEPFQLVAFEPGAYQQIGIYETSVLREHSEEGKQAGEEHKKASLAAAARRKMWKQFFKLPKNERVIHLPKNEKIDIYDFIADFKDVHLLDDTTIYGNVWALAELQFPIGLKIKGALILSNNNYNPKDFNHSVETDTLELKRFRQIPPNIKYKNLELESSHNIDLPPNLHVEGNLVMMNDTFMDSTKVLEGLYVGGNLGVMGTVNTDDFPKDFHVGSFTGYIRDNSGRSQEAFPKPRYFNRITMEKLKEIIGGKDQTVEPERI